jgi:hypothetical protein
MKKESERKASETGTRPPLICFSSDGMGIGRCDMGSQFLSHFHPMSLSCSLRHGPGMTCVDALGSALLATRGSCTTQKHAVPLQEALTATIRCPLISAHQPGNSPPFSGPLCDRIGPQSAQPITAPLPAVLSGLSAKPPTGTGHLSAWSKTGHFVYPLLKFSRDPDEAQEMIFLSPSAQYSSRCFKAD